MSAIAVGAHRLLCGDITEGAIDQLMGPERADVIYSDPPWGPGNQQYWHTMRARGSCPRTSWAEFLATFCQVCVRYRTPNAPVFVEMGLRWEGELVEAMAAVGLPRQRRFRTFYGSKQKPTENVLSLFGHADADIAMPAVAHGEPVTRAALGGVVRPGDLVLDPCTGLGMTARIAHVLGAQFRGLEMNATRLARTEAWLRKRVDRLP
jgi:hypothetical protein